MMFGIMNRKTLVVLLWLSFSHLPLSSHYQSVTSNSPIIFPTDDEFYCAHRKDEIKQLKLEYSWKNLVFGFPSENDRQLALRNGNYQPESVTPIDVDVQYSSGKSEPRVFVTIPRFAGGVPYSLAVVSKNVKANGSELRPYPDYKWHSSHGEDCNGLTSVYRVHIDECNHMWVLDSGEIDFKQHCRPQVVVLDLNTDRMIHRYRLPDGNFKPWYSRFVTPFVDVSDPPPRGNCLKAIVYMADPTGQGFVVYDVQRNKSWRVENKFTLPDLAFGTHTIAGESFEFMDGAFSFSATPKKFDVKERLLYFHSLSSGYQMAIPLPIVNDPTKWESGFVSSLSDFITLGNRGVQCGPEAISEKGYHFCGYMEPIGIFAWDIRKLYISQNRCVVAYNPKTLQFVSGLKIRKDNKGREVMWVLSDRLQKILNGTINYSEINFRIQSCSVDALIKGAPCF